MIALNRPCTEFTAEAIANIFIEGLVAPGYAASALTLLATKPNVRVLENTTAVPLHYEMKGIVGGLLLQERDWQVMTREDLKIVTALVPSDEQIATMLFAWRVLKHIKSNAILIAKSETTVGIGAGQVSRVDAVEIAIRKAGAHIRETILASDAFFPFRDSIDCMATTGIRAIIQPGGSKRDDEVITACNEQEIAMVFTGKRCFKH
ncbi:MAG: bifunctional purine biosynthesis protein PurH [uncultured bacterium]|nr:MAG: bifunctional purine biosynthesis protein PurH [uncultured bacterium]